MSNDFHNTTHVESRSRAELRNFIIQPILIPFLFLIFLACLLPTGMVSLGSITMAVLYPVLTLIYSYYRGLAAGDMAVCFVGALIMSILVIYMHRSNIKRIR